ncbi:hypothetical protein J2S55_002161 [Streptosporangium brasiliense]|uniref:Uncharacterized protein n=1 Tax=Streptosporangium brasiliense TaxID=47480 RepID=A0ABT9R368_9ACTN|nr:hypothetical protein [Streptosporangium brasiliense]
MTSTLTSDLTALAPAAKPASNFWISGTWTPPTKPTWFFFDFSAAAAPMMKEPSCSANRRLEMLGPVAAASSTIANLTSGNSAATFFTGPE